MQKMNIRIGNLELTPLEKAKTNHGLQETDELLPIRVVVNTLKKDKEGHTMSNEVFDNDTVNYLLTKGRFDWFHKSTSGDPIYTIGKPVKFEIEDGLPVVYGYLLKSHDFVRKSIMPMLKSGLNMLSASMGGGIKKMVNNTIKKIHWDHIALAPSALVMSEGSDVALAKAAGNVTCLNYSGFDSFFKDISLASESVLMKALSVESATDMESIGSGYQATQGLPGSSYHQDKSKKEWSDDIEYAISLFSIGVIDPKEKSIKKHFESAGYSGDKLNAITNDFVKIVKKL